MGLLFIILGAILLAFMGDFSVLAILLVIGLSIGITLLAASSPGVFVVVAGVVLLLAFLSTMN